MTTRSPRKDESAGLPKELAGSSLLDELRVRSVTRVHGGDIASAYGVVTDEGPLFVKTHPRPTPGLFEREAAGLRALGAHASPELRVPRVIREGPRGLVLEWISVGGRRSRATEESLGRGLAQLHAVNHERAFGGLDEVSVGYIGSVPVDLTPCPTWAEFYLERRLRPLVDLAVQRGRLDPRARNVLEELAPHVEDLCGLAEPPALLHGDLWAGNRLIDEEGQNWLIDPACHYGHREVDLGMMQLFGGFGPECFAAYDEVYPLVPGWQERVPWYQLTPLLVHAVLFGGGYGDAALRALNRYR